MAKNYDLFLERMRQKYNLPQTTYKSQTALQRQNALSKTQDQFYNPAKAEEPQTTFDSLSGWNKFGSMYHQARTSFETSFLDLGEGVIDAILTGVGSVAQWVGAEGLEDTMRDWTQAEWLSTLPQQDWFNDIFGLDFLFSDDAKKAGRNKEALPEIVDQVASGMGSAVGYGLLNMVPVVGPALAWMGGGGAAAEEALNEGAGTTAAMLYGGAVGGVEFATEKFLGKGLEKAGLGLGKVAGFGKSTAKSVGKTAISKIISNVGRNFLEEGTEEVVSELVDPLLQRFTYKRDESLKELYGEQITAEGLIETFLVGGLTGGIFEGANISMGVVTSGGLKNWDIRQEAQELNRINSEMQRAILKGEEAKVQKLQNEKNQKIEEVKSKFETFVEEVKTKPSVKKIVAATQYETQREMTREDLTLDAAKKVLNGKTKKGEAPKINVEYAPTQNNVQTNSYYDPKKNTVYLNKQNLSNLNDALETIVHEAGHAIHTGGLNTNFVNSMTQDFTDFDSLVSENYKGTITNMNELITYYEKVKGYGTELEKSNILEEKIKESKISKEQAYAELRDNYMLEEIANDIFGKKYFSNLLEVRSAIMGQKPSVIQKIKEAYRKRFTNTTNKPSNYKEVMQIFKDGIEQNYENFRESIKNETKSQRTSETRSKLDETKSSTISEEELENDVDSNGNKLSKEQIEYFKNSAVRDENGNLMVVYHGTFYGGFTIFNENSYDNVVFFTNDKFMASTYSGYNENDIEFGKENTGLYSVYLNIEKPLIVDARDSNWDNITFYQNKPKDYQNEYDAVNSLKNLKGFVHNFFYKRTSKLDYRISSLQNVLSKIKNGKISIEDKDFELELQQEIASLEKQKENLEDVLNPKNIQDLLNEVNKNVENDLKFEFVKNDKWLQPTILLKGKYFEDYITLDFLVNNVEKLNYYFDRMVQARALDRLESNFKTLMTTREIVEYAQKQGKYDGVIIRNVYDYSGPVGVDTETTPSQDVYVTLKSPNQIKAIDNKKPTRSTDIRYKLDEKTTETQEIEPKVETKKVQEKKPEYTKYDLTEYETETSLYKLGADLIVKIAEIENNSTKNFLSKDTPYNLAAKIKEATTYEEANNLLNEYKNRVYLINKYYSQLKDVFNKMKNKNFKTAKIAKEVESRIGAINKYQGISNVKNYVINFLTDENTKELETYVEKLSQKTDEQIEKQVAKRQKQIEKEREEQRLKEEKEVEERRNINAKLVKDNYQKQIDTLIDNYPFEANKDDVKTKKEALETLLNELNYETYQQGLTITKNNEESFSKDSLRGKIDYALKQFEKLIKANEKEAEAIIDKELDTYITHINLVKSEIDQKFKDIGGKADDTKIRLNKRLEDISNSIDEINTLINGSTNDTIGIKDTIENMRSDIKSFAKDIRPYLNKKADELEQLQKEQNEKLDKLRDVLDKKQAEQKEKVAKAKAKEQEIAEKEVSSIKEDYQKDLNELTEEFKDYSKSIDESLKNKVQEKINALNTTNYKDTTELDELFSQYEDALNKAKTADEERIRKEIEEVQKKNEKKPKTEQVKETIKFIRTTVYKYNESAKSIKEKANATQMKVYTKVACEELIKMVENALSIVGAENNTQVRVYFSEGSKRTAIDEMFEAFNTLANDNAKLVERLKEIISRGLEIKMPDYEIKNNRIYKKGRNTFTNVNDFTIQETELGKRINSELSYLIQTAIDTKGSPTILAKKIMERTSEYVKTIQKQQETIDKLIAEQNVAATKIKDQVSTSTTNEELNKVYEEINKSNERITKLEKAIEKNTIDKEKSKKTISKLKENNANLKSKLYEQTKTVEKITKENIELKTNLEGTYKVTRNDRNYINRGIEKLGIKNRLDTATFKKISEYYNKGDFDGVVDTIMEFVKNQKVEREYYDENMELKTEMVSFDEVYSELNAEQMAQEFKDYILDRINNPRVTKRSALPEALEKLAELRKEIKSEKETASELKTIKSSLSSIRQLANNQRKSIFSNNIDKRFKAIAQKLERFSQRKMLSGDFRETLKEFKKFLTEEKFEGQTFQEMTGLEFPQELFNQLDALENVQGQVTIEELKLYNKILSALKTFIENGTGQRKITIDGEEYILEDYVKEAIEEQKEILNKFPKEKWSKIFQTVDPRVVFKIISGFNENSKFYKLFKELQKGDTNAMMMEMQLKDKLVEFNKKNKKFKKKVLNAKTTINDITTTKGKFISIYKLIRRRNAYVHILKNGIDIDGKTITFANEEQIVALKNAIADNLELKKQGSIMKEYFDLTVDFFTEAGKVKVEIDRQLYGYENIEEGEYFPIQISSLDFNRTLGDKKYVSKMAASFNYSWLQSVVGSGGAVKVGDVQEIIDLHSRQVADYYGYGLPLDMFNQIYSFKVEDEQTKAVLNLKRLVNDRFGLTKSGKYAMEDYLKVLFDDIRGVNTYSGELDKMFKKAFSSLRKKYSTYVLGANLKVAGVQLAAIPAAHKYVSWKNIGKAVGKIDWEKYPLPSLGKYRTYDKTILKSETMNDQISKWADGFGILMTKMDNLTIKFAWKAALHQTNFDTKKATELFEKIVRETQPQYSAIERSGLMRNKNDLVKLLTQFQSQSNKNFSTLMEIYYKAKYYKKLGLKLSKEDINQFRMSVESIALQGIFATALTYLFKFLLHDLDDDEISVLGVLENFFNDNILGLIPLMNNIKVDLQGEGKILGFINLYEVNLGMINKLYDAFGALNNLTNDDKALPNKIYGVVNAFGVASGIPTENLYKYSMAILKWILPNKAFSWDANTKGITFTNKSEINEALQSGKINVAQQYYQTYTSNILELDVNTTNVLFNLYKKGYTGAYIKQVPKTLVVDNEQIEVNREQFMKTYSKLAPKLQKLVKSNAFITLSDEEKEKAISKLVNAYYTLAKKECIGDEDLSDLEMMIKYIDFNSNNYAYLVHISTFENTKTQTRKQQVQRYINSLSLSAGEKYLLYVLSGYSISDNNMRILKSFLSSRGMPTKQIKLFLE